MNAVHSLENGFNDAPCEQLVRFGPAGELVGILGGVGATGPTLLLPSAGLQPRAGPFRLHALLALKLAQLGIRSFRFDVPGVGEASRRSDLDGPDATIAAMDCLEAEHSCRSFAVGGICSAADIAWQAATLDGRVAGLLLLDGVCYRGPWYYYSRAACLLRRMPAEWRHFARAIDGRLRGRVGLDSSAFRSWPDRQRARDEFESLLDRDVRLLVIYSGGYEDRFLNPRQFHWAFGPRSRDPKVTLHYWPDCDHTYFHGGHRERLLDEISRWMSLLASGRSQ